MKDPFEEVREKVFSDESARKATGGELSAMEAIGKNMIDLLFDSQCTPEELRDALWTSLHLVDQLVIARADGDTNVSIMEKVLYSPVETHH